MDESKITKSASKDRRPPAADKSRSPKIEAADPSTTPERLTELADQSVELARVVAKNPSTPEQLLIKLSRSHDVSIRRFLAGNPSTPLDVLHSVGKKFPKELLKNPALDLLLLENPNLLREFPSSILSTLLKQDDCPMGVLTQAVLVDDEVVLLAICRHAAATPEMMQRLQASTYTTVRTAASLHVSQTQTVRNWQEQLQATVVEILRQAMPTQRLRFLPLLRAAGQLLTDEQSSADMSPPAFYAIVEGLTHIYSDAAVLERCVKGGRGLLFPVAMLERLANDEDCQVLQGVAKNSSNPGPVLERLACDEETSVRKVIGDGSDLLERLTDNNSIWLRSPVGAPPQELMTRLEHLTSNDKPHLRAAVACHPATPIQLLEKLAEDKAEQIRNVVAMNPSTPPWILERLAEDESSDVRSGVARNSSTPLHILERLACDKDSDVSDVFGYQSNTLERLTGDEGRWLRYPVGAPPVELMKRLEHFTSSDKYRLRVAVAWHPATPIQLLEKLAEDKAESVRNVVAMNPSTPPWILERLAEDESTYVRIDVARNLSTPLHILERLACDAEYLVQCAFSDGPGLLEQLTGDNGRWLRSPVGTPPQELLTRLEHLASSDKPRLRAAVAWHPATPIKLLERLAEDENSDVRQAVANNPSASIHILECLKEKENEADRGILWKWATCETIPKWLGITEDDEMRRAIDGSPAITAYILGRLAAYSAKSMWSMRRDVLRNRALPIATLECSLQDRDNAVVRYASKCFREKEIDLSPPCQLSSDERALMEHLLARDAQNITNSDSPSPARLLALLSPWAPEEALANSSRSTWWEERAAIATNPKTPAATRAKLTEDGNAIVRAAARATIETLLA